MKSEICLLCRNRVSGAYSLVAPWITELSVLTNQESCFFQCRNCTYSWFSRFSEETLIDIYSEYRTSKYYKARHSWEPWYGQKENGAFSSKVQNSDYGGNQIKGRRERIDIIFQEAQLDLASLRGCLDLGGDEGQFIPNDISGPKFVVDQDTAKQSFEDLISFVSDIRDVPNNSVDLAMMCMVLEHLNSPRSTLELVSQKIRHGKFLYIEVPKDSFRISRFHNNKLYRHYLIVIRKIKLLFVFIDFLTGLYRFFKHKIPFWGIIKQSEHINYFSSQNIKQILSELGFSIRVLIEEESSGQGKIRLGSIRLIAQRA